ncbi:MFS general substrate transporter [Punctularia strigosozonata HHB-11173 SS5]|uniref:MFS general substrate transporter n=1 Tax=Punctularia strigosozonata (strain HHB-11173) TaxID=741275 RepID=UPI00044179D6|nr:MFS general substrate transporter [Punctularia strigosozonata HHB-11173 SS5]EIN07031.1 MFS general substrate transporter [Punctularia strigosozonata HHB-11173 SS5]
MPGNSSDSLTARVSDAGALDEKSRVHDPEAYLRKEQESDGAPVTIPEEDRPGLDDFPDGGLRAWLVLFGAVCNTAATFGFVNSWGVFQSYYESNTLQNTSPSTIAWIGSIQYSLTFLPGLVTGRLFDIGYFRVPLAVASALLVMATFLIAECTEYWQFLLCQGLAVGLACGTIFGPTMGVISHWFKRRRSTALGIVAIGSSTGGTVLPIIFRNLVGPIGFKWTMRVIGFILLVTVGISNATLKRRLPPVRLAGGFVNLGALRNPAFAVYCLAGFMCFLGLYTVLTYIEVSATAAHVPPDFAFYLISIANAASAFGRIGSGYMADKIGALNIMIPFTLLAGVLTYIWPFLHSKSAYIALAIFYGIGSGAFVSLIVSPVMLMGEIGDVGRRVGLFFTIAAIGALSGPPISGAINNATGNFKPVGVYAGSAVMVAVGLMILTRHILLQGDVWGKC